MAGVAGIAVLIVLAIDTVIVVAIAKTAAAFFNDLAARHPERTPEAGAVSRSFQSFRHGVLNLGWCGHVTVDGFGVHVRPAWLPRVAGARGSSVPWTAIEVRERSGRMVTVRVGATEFAGPAWALTPGEEAGK